MTRGPLRHALLECATPSPPFKKLHAHHRPCPCRFRHRPEPPRLCSSRSRHRLCSGRVALRGGGHPHRQRRPHTGRGRVRGGRRQLARLPRHAGRTRGRCRRAAGGVGRLGGVRRAQTHCRCGTAFRPAGSSCGRARMVLRRCDAQSHGEIAQRVAEVVGMRPDAQAAADLDACMPSLPTSCSAIAGTRPRTAGSAAWRGSRRMAPREHALRLPPS